MKTMTKPSEPVSDRGLQNEKQLRHDRVVGMIVLVVLFVLFALLMWLASFGGAEVESFDYWMQP